jgi:hypothetical protein
MVEVVAVHARLGLAFAVQPLLYVDLQPPDDGGVQLFEVELANDLASALLNDVQDTLHVFLRQLLDIEAQLFLLGHRDNRNRGLRVVCLSGVLP